jgi:hypothetical protein
MSNCRWQSPQPWLKVTNITPLKICKQPHGFLQARDKGKFQNNNPIFLSVSLRMMMVMTLMTMR